MTLKKKAPVSGFRVPVWLPYAMIAPSLIGIGTFVVYPLISLARLSLWRTNLMSPSQSEFVGLNNYRTLFTRDDFWQSLRNTVVYTVSVVLIVTILALILAMWIYKSTRYNRLVQGAIFIPHIVSILSVSLVWAWMLSVDGGLFNSILRSLGLTPLRWLQSSETAMLSIVIVMVWKSLGYFVLILVAARNAIPQSIYEAATLDNAKPVRVFFQITLPMLSPQLFFVLVIMTIGSFRMFEAVQIMTRGGPNLATNTLVYYIYSNVFEVMRIGLAASAAMVLTVVVSLLTLLYFTVLSKKVHYQ